MIKIIDKHKARLVVEVGNGSKRKRKTKVITYTGKRDLQNQYADFEREATAPPLSGLTVDELLQSYIKNRKMLGLKPTTEHGYNSARKRINEVFDGVLAKELTTYMLDEFIMQMTEKYSPKTIANTIFPLNAAYERAIKTGQLTHNPCTNVTLPKRAKKEIKTLSLDEMIKLMTALEDERLDYMVGYELCLLCGMRRSEVLALREDDLNLMFKFVTISKSRHIVDGKEYIQDTKTERSHRTLALPEKLVEDIARLIELHHSQVWNHCDYLIQDGFGHPMNPATFSDRITYIEDGIGISRVSVHGLRHTFATLLNSEGVDIAQISAELGHSNISTTLNIYTHVFGDVTASSRGIASAIDRKLKGDFTALDDKEKTIGA